MLVYISEGSSGTIGIIFSIFLAPESQRGCPFLTYVQYWGDLPGNLGVSIIGVENFLPYILRGVCSLQEHCKEDQCVKREGFLVLQLAWVRKLLILGIWVVSNLKICRSLGLLHFYIFLGRGSTVEMWVIFYRRLVLVILTFAVVVSLIDDHRPLSVLIAFISQFRSSWSRFPIRDIPRNVKGFGSRKMSVEI